jgi:uncharacterized peroxidase-related enzyme
VESHAEFLRRVTVDDELAAALRQDHTEANLSEQDRAMLDFAVKLTKHAYKMTERDVQKLRDAGFGDQAILQIAMIASWFNYANRIADAFGLGK